MAQSPVAIFDELHALPTEAAAAKIGALLDERTLDGTTDHRGVPARVLLTEMMLDLGWPHALSLDPTDVEALRQHTYALSSKTRSTRGWVFATGLFAGAWCFVMTGLFFAAREPFGAGSFFGGVIAAAAAVVGAGTWREDVAARLYGWVGNRWSLLATALLMGRAGFIVGAAPSVVLVLMCMWAARALRRKSEHSPGLPLHTPAR